MSGTTKRPLARRLTFYLDGNLNQFQCDLNETIRQTSSVVLVGYTVINTPVTATFPNTPFLKVAFDYGSGFNATPQVSNVTGWYDMLLPLDGATTGRFSLLTTVGELQSMPRTSIRIRVFDAAGVEHNASTNKLFASCLIELMVVEAGMMQGPLALQSVPTIQAAFDTI